SGGRSSTSGGRSALIVTGGVLGSGRKKNTVPRPSPTPTTTAEIQVRTRRGRLRFWGRKSSMAFLPMAMVIATMPGLRFLDLGSMEPKMVVSRPNDTGVLARTGRGVVTTTGRGVVAAPK